MDKFCPRSTKPVGEAVTQTHQHMQSLVQWHLLTSVNESGGLALGKICTRPHSGHLAHRVLLTLKTPYTVLVFHCGNADPEAHQGHELMTKLSPVCSSPELELQHHPEPSSSLIHGSTSWEAHSTCLLRSVSTQLPPCCLPDMCSGLGCFLNGLLYPVRSPFLGSLSFDPAG